MIKTDEPRLLLVSILLTADKEMPSLRIDSRLYISAGWFKHPQLSYTFKSIDSQWHQ